MKRSLKKLKGLPGGPNEKIFSTDGYRSTSPDVNNPFNIIPSGNITMKEKDGTPLRKGPLMGTDNLGNSQIMFPGADYQFPGNMVTETPLAKRGGQFQNSNITATNKLFAVNKLFKKRKKGKRARGIYNPKAKYTYQPGGETYNQLPARYADALKNFVYPEVVNSSEETGYDAGLGVIKQNPNDPITNVNNPWWYEHELMHHLQNQAGGMSTYGTVGLRPNPYVASDESMASYYDRRGSEFQTELNRILKENPDISEEEAYARAEEDLYNNPTTTEGEARNYEGYIEAGNPSIFPKQKDGGESGCPEGFYNDPVQGCVKIEDPSTFYENWFQNRVMPTPEGQKLLDKIRPEALERSRASVPYIFDENLGPNEAGYYDVDTRQIMLNKFLPEAQIQATKYHERVHDIQAGDKFTSALEKPQGYLVEQNIVEPKAINTGNPEWDKNLKKNYEDIVDPNEIHARVMTLRRLAGFRPDQTITEKDLQDYFKAVKDSGGKLDPDIEDLKGVTKGTKSIVNLLNDMVYTPALQDDLKMAQFGGSQQPCPIGYEWNGIECIPNLFETRPSQRAAVYMDKDGNYQIDPAYQQYSQQKFDVSESNRKAQEFNKLYAQSKNYKRLLKKQGYTPEEIKDRISSVMNINDFRYIDEGPSWVSANEDTGNEFISYNVTDPGDWPGFDQIAAHEWGHVGVDSGANPLKPKEREEFINRINKEQAGVTGVESDLQHDMEPQENRADLVQLRQQLQEAGVFDSTKRKKFTKKDLNKYREIMKSSERNWDNMWNRMFRLYDDDSIIHFMNNVAKNNSNEDVQVAKYGFELDLTEDEIQKYVKGGYVVEDISVPSLTRWDNGGEKRKRKNKNKDKEYETVTSYEKAPESTYTPIDPNFLAENPDVYSQIVNKPEVSTGREGSDIGKLRAEYRDKNPMDIFLDEKKRQYLKKNKGLNKAAGVTMENFPEDVLQNFMSEYNYKTNNYAVNKLGKKEGWNPKRRGEWVDELTPGEKDAVAESKYGSKLQPSYWSRSLAGVQELGNTLLPGQPFQYNIPGLTKKEQKEMRDSKLSALEILAPIDIPGAAIANLTKNTGLSTGSDYKEQPNVFAGEKMANVSDTEAMAFNPLTYAGLEAIPELGVNLVKGIGRGITMAPEAISNLGKFITREPNVVSSVDNVAGSLTKTDELAPVINNVDLRAKVLESVPKDAPYVISDELLPDYKTFKTKGSSITYDEGVDLLENMANKYPVLQESPRIPIYYHGTTSASLPGIIKNEGLLPVGELIKEGKIPLTGELGAGVAGINNANISTAMARGHQGALDYAIGLSGKNKINVEDDLAKWFERGGRESFVESPYSPDISFYDDLKNKRLTEWQNLSDAEKALVQDNYPVMFGINPTKGNAERFTIPRTDISDEVGISGKINFEEIPSIFVPKSKVAELQQQLGTKTKVLPIEDFMQDYRNAGKYNQMGYAKGGIVSELTKKEIDKLIKQGYIIEEID
jgi:hypothetical protein